MNIIIEQYGCSYYRAAAAALIVAVVTLNYFTTMCNSHLEETVRSCDEQHPLVSLLLSSLIMSLLMNRVLIPNCYHNQHRTPSSVLVIVDVAIVYDDV